MYFARTEYEIAAERKKISKIAKRTHSARRKYQESGPVTIIRPEPKPAAEPSITPTEPKQD